MKNLSIYLMLMGLMLISCVSSDYQPLETVKSVDLNRYMGKWYDIASFPQWFQKGCNCSTAEYTMDKGFVRVINSCRKGGPDGKFKQVSGKAFVVEGSNNAKLKVQFFFPFKGNYWIIELADDYSYAVVGDQSRKYLWILSRTPEMDSTIYNDLLKKIALKGFDVNKLVKTNQKCNQN